MNLPLMVLLVVFALTAARGLRGLRLPIWQIMAWKSGIRMALTYPLTGVGAGQFATKLGTEFRPPEYGAVGGQWQGASPEFRNLRWTHP